VGAALVLSALLLGATGCVSVADFRKLEHEVAVLQQSSKPGHDLADLSVELEDLRETVARMEGRIEVAEHQTRVALQEARAARQEAVNPGTRVEPLPGGGVPPETPAAQVDPATGGSAADVQAYRHAHSAWRAQDTQACIDRFQEFLQTYPTSAYADDAAYWMADCYFKQGDYRAAILRFDDVASGYPTGDKAPDALYRQGEALIRLGPGYANAARRAFQRVTEEYPDSPRAGEAQRQLEVLGPG
jgi:tol-pal system protein YbgF